MLLKGCSLKQSKQKQSRVAIKVLMVRSLLLYDSLWLLVSRNSFCPSLVASIPIVQPTLTPIQVNDTVTGNPLMVVPLNVGDSTRIELGLSESDRVSLCYEVHGEANQNFNLVSDMCVSVNAHYMRAKSDVDTLLTQLVFELWVMTTIVAILRLILMAAELLWMV